ncbi:MAG: PEP-CTERM sorting domain-containing protein [Hyphomicrobiales bacterium]|nr:PEP-CTERM sorting domain-containing protein [Hyphomicrobiales bacterium]
MTTWARWDSLTAVPDAPKRVAALRNMRSAYNPLDKLVNFGFLWHPSKYWSGEDVTIKIALERHGHIVALLSMLFVPTIGSAAIYDVAADFESGWSAQTNPNGVWSYGYSAGFTAPVTLYDKTVQNGVNGPNAQYWLAPAVDVGTSPSAEYNNGPAFDNGNVNFLANEFLLVSGIAGQYSDLIFTAPASGKYSIESSFRGSQHGIGTVVGVLNNGNLLFNSSVTAVGQIVPFDSTLNLTTGEMLEFSVGPGGGLQNTGLSLVITTGNSSVPEPATWAMILVGFASLGFARYCWPRADRVSLAA